MYDCYSISWGEGKGVVLLDHSVKQPQCKIGGRGEGEEWGSSAFSEGCSQGPHPDQFPRFLLGDIQEHGLHLSQEEVWCRTTTML